MTARKVWCGTNPTHCDICGRTLVNSGVFVDGKTAFGPWAIMCSGCHGENGGKLGTGWGQKYVFEQETCLWVKVEG